MKAKDLRIVFLGTPGFAAAILKALVENGYNITGVITAPDKPAKRGLKIQSSEVKKYAEQKRLKILQPKNLKSPDFLAELSALKADLQIIAAFRMLPEAVWKMPPMGTINLHAAYLPQYRGAAPINRAVMNGETETGITTFFINETIDTGQIIFREKAPIHPDDTAGTLHDRLMNKGAALVLKTVDAIAEGNVQTVLQETLIDNPEALKTAPKIFKEDCRVKWNKTAAEIYNQIRGLCPCPCAWSEIEKDKYRCCVKIYKCEVVNRSHEFPPGTTISDNKTYLHVAAGKDLISIKDLQIECKKRMNIEDFLKGFRGIEEFQFV